jgi:hypothetical protein
MATVTFKKGVKLSDGKLYSYGETADISDDLLKEAKPFVKADEPKKVLTPPDKGDTKQAPKSGK